MNWSEDWVDLLCMAAVLVLIIHIIGEAVMQV